MNKTGIKFINIFRIFLKSFSWNICSFLNGSVMFLLFFSVASSASISLCKGSLQVGGGSVEVDLQNIFLRKGDRRSLGQWIKGLDSPSARQRRNVINYLLDEEAGGLSRIKRKYQSVYPVVYHRMLEVVQSDINPDLQLIVFRALYEMNFQDDNLRRLAAMNSQFYHEINVINESSGELIIEDGIYKEDY